ncbi:MAG TPA: hypothetical protein VF079_02645 [Sphingomicrobium sp.]
MKDSRAVQSNWGDIDMDTSGPGLIGQLIGLAIAAAIAFWVYKDAESRGMSGIGWGIFTFLLCIIALPVYLIVRKPQTGANP